MNQDNYQVEELLEESIRAANRTTRAVRAIAILFLYLIPFELAAGLIAGISYMGLLANVANGENPGTWFGGYLAAIVIMLVGIVFTIVSAFRELLKSKVAARPNSRVFEEREVSENIPFSSDN